MSDNVPPQVPPNRTQINRTIAEVAHTLKKDRYLGGPWRNWTSEKIRERGEAYMDGSRTLFDECHPWMRPNDKDDVITKYKLARDALASLDNSRASWIQNIQEARNARKKCKETYRVTKRASDRGLDHSSVLGPLGGADPSGTSTFIYELFKATSEISLNSYKTAREWIPDTTMTTLSSGDAGMAGPIDEVPGTFSFIYDESSATSGTSITSYKTEKTINSRKSRLNVRPRHKYADHSYSRPQGPEPLGVEDALDPKTEVGDGCDQPLSSPPSGTQPLDGPSTASPDTEGVPGRTQSRPPSPHQGDEFPSANPAGLTGGEQEGESSKAEVSNRSSVSLFEPNWEADAD